MEASSEEGAYPSKVTGEQIGAALSHPCGRLSAGLSGQQPLSSNNQIPRGLGRCVQRFGNAPWMKDGNSPFSEVMWTGLSIPSPPLQTCGHLAKHTECELELERRGPIPERKDTKAEWILGGSPRADPHARPGILTLQHRPWPPEARSWSRAPACSWHLRRATCPGKDNS